MDTAIFLLGTTLVGVAVIWLLGLSLREHLSSLWPIPERDQDTVIVSEVRVIVPETLEAYIPMPDALTTHAEMVGWIAKDLPRLVAENQGSGPR